MIADKVFLTKGVGVHKEQLTSFEMALRDAGIAPFNLVHVSSIYQPNCKRVSDRPWLHMMKERKNA